MHYLLKVYRNKILHSAILLNVLFVCSFWELSIWIIRSWWQLFSCFPLIVPLISWLFSLLLFSIELNRTNLNRSGDSNLISALKENSFSIWILNRINPGVYFPHLNFFKLRVFLVLSFKLLNHCWILLNCSALF